MSLVAFVTQRGENSGICSMRKSLPVVITDFAVTLQAQPAGLALRNAKIVNLSPSALTAQAFSDRGATWRVGPSTKVINLDRVLAVPGFSEAQPHLSGLGEFRAGFDLREARTRDKVDNSALNTDTLADIHRTGESVIQRGVHLRVHPRRLRTLQYLRRRLQSAHRREGPPSAHATGSRLRTFAERVVRFKRSISAAAFLFPPVFRSACSRMLRSIVASVCS